MQSPRQDAPEQAVPDARLLAQYAAGGSAEAFAEIVRRHSGMVYAACLRILGDGAAAEDAAQAAFILLMRRAKALPAKTVLASWLYFAAQNSARAMRRGDLRRARRERAAAEASEAARREGAEEAAAMEANDSSSGVWREIRGEIDAAICALPAVQRDAIVLRYLRGHSVREAARSLGCPEETLHTRVTRALQRLRGMLGRRGAALSAVALAALLAERTAAAAPAGLAANILGACSGTAAASAAAVGAADAVVKAAAVAKLKVAAAALVLCAAAAAPVAVYRATPAAVSAASAAPVRPAAPGYFSDFDALKPEEASPNELVRLKEPGGDVTAIVSKEFPSGTSNWKPEVHIELSRQIAEGASRVLFKIPENIEIRIRIKSDKPGKWYFSQQPAAARSQEEGLASDLIPCDAQWRDVVLRSGDLIPYRRPHVHTPDLAPGLEIQAIAIYGYGASKIFIDRIEIVSAAGGKSSL